MIENSCPSRFTTIMVAAKGLEYIQAGFWNQQPSTFYNNTMHVVKQLGVCKVPIYVG